MSIPVGSGPFVHPRWLGRWSEHVEIPSQGDALPIDHACPDTSIHADLVRAQ